MINNYNISIGNKVTTIYDNINQAKIIIDFEYDGLYFKYQSQPWITLSLGPKTEINECYNINTHCIKTIFKNLCFYAYEELKNIPNASNILFELRNIIDLFM